MLNFERLNGLLLNIFHPPTNLWEVWGMTEWSELEFLNKMPNPGILESRYLRRGRIEEYFFCPTIF
jgi:hypothetical protein